MRTYRINEDYTARALRLFCERTGVRPPAQYGRFRWLLNEHSAAIEAIERELQQLEEKEVIGG